MNPIYYVYFLPMIISFSYCIGSRELAYALGFIPGINIVLAGCAICEVVRSIRESKGDCIFHKFEEDQDAPRPHRRARRAKGGFIRYTCTCCGAKRSEKWSM